MSRNIKTVLTIGSGGVVIDTQCHLSNGLPSIVIVGLGNKSIDEAKERVRSSFANSHIAMPRKRITINLAPADIPKESTSFDLAIAVAILQAAGQLSVHIAETTAFIGELGLDGEIRAVRGIIGKLLVGKRAKIGEFFIPAANLAQAQLVPGISLVPVKTVQEMYAILTKQIEITRFAGGNSPLAAVLGTADVALDDIVGQERAKRALQIAAAGGHNLLLSGPPGTGKSMLAKALVGILPPLTQAEMLEVTQLHSLIGGNYEQLITQRPFRAPHHSASHIAVVGGGNNLRPGEISLAHRGVLFFDELPEFQRSTIEALRQPLEDRSITVSRARDSAVYPANFMLVATANPCPCGYYGTSKPCDCSAHRIREYRQKLSGPIIDRIDLYVDVDQVDHRQLLAVTTDIGGQKVKKAVAQARQLQQQRYGRSTKLNATMSNRDIKGLAQLSQEAQEVLNQAAERLTLSARSYMRLIKVARTIADLEQSPTIQTAHVAEALQYRGQTQPIID